MLDHVRELYLPVNVQFLCGQGFQVKLASASGLDHHLPSDEAKSLFGVGKKNQIYLSVYKVLSSDIH